MRGPSIRGGAYGQGGGDVSERLEETVAHLVRTVEELSDVVARQDAEIARLTARVQMLMTREAEREAAEGGAVALSDKPPPHW